MSRIDWSEHPSIWTMRVSSDGVPLMILNNPPKPVGGPIRFLGEKSSIFAALDLRARELLPGATSVVSAQPPKQVGQPEAVAHDDVAALRYSFGARLRILYLADVGIVGDNDPEDALRENALLAECARQNVRCLSSRALMSDQLARHYTPARGFGNSIIGEGHLNAAGHRMAASLAKLLVEGS
jgi:hypothetical protein